VSLENITKRFVDLGLGDEEATVLRDLYLAGEAKAGDLARSSGLSRIKVYRVLDRLQEMNIVEASLWRPVIFSAIPPESAAERLIHRASSQLKTTESAREQVIEELARFKQQTRPQSEAKYRIDQGKSQIHSWMAKMAAYAGKEILAYVERDDLMKIYYTGILEELAKARRRGGAKVMILTDVDYSLAGAVKNYEGYAGIRHTRIPGMSILLAVDESELLVSATAKAEGSSDQDVALWMNGKNFVAGIRGLLHDSWENAVEARTRINIIKEGGRALQDMLIVRGQQPLSEFYAGMTSRAKKEVLHASVPYDTRFFNAFARKALAAGRADIKIGLLTCIDDSSLEQVKGLRDICEVRHIESSAGVNINLVDGEEVLLAPDASSSRARSAIWSSVSDYVEHYRAVFENLWSSSTEMEERISQVEMQSRARSVLSSMQKALEGAGFQARRTAAGASGFEHEFAIVAAGRGGMILVDVASDKADYQRAMIGFAVKCMDVKADHKILISMHDT
jgi:sugar-specific transcriptional regulator TrmB